MRESPGGLQGPQGQALSLSPGQQDLGAGPEHRHSSEVPRCAAEFGRQVAESSAGLTATRCLGPTPGCLTPEVETEAWERAFLISPHVMLRLPMGRPHLEDHQVREE